MSQPEDSSPIASLIAVQARMDSLSRFLSESIKLNAPINNRRLADFASSEISAAIDQIILNGTALLSSAVDPPPHAPNPAKIELQDQAKEPEIDGGDLPIVEIDAEELLEQRVHVCEICGKGFRRDANLRMHMRAHGDRFKTAEALTKPASSGSCGAAVRFSCPSPGCNRNKAHWKFRPLKSAVCARNHFKRSHCPKMYSCNRCEKKRFSLLADLRNHLRTCLAATSSARWRCSCGTTFSRKEKLFGHVTFFEGHLPEEFGDENVGRSVKDETEAEFGDDGDMICDEDDVFDGLLHGFGSVDERFSLQDVLGI